MTLRRIVVLLRAPEQLSRSLQQILAILQCLTKLPVRFLQVVRLFGMRRHRSPTKGAALRALLEPPTMLRVPFL